MKIWRCFSVTLYLTGYFCQLTSSPKSENLSGGRPSKLLKTPRIYNALITSDDHLQLSQAYPALAPVVQGIHYQPAPVPSLVGSVVPIPTSQFQLSNDHDGYSYSLKQDLYHYGAAVDGNSFKFDIPKIPEQKDPNEPISLFRPLIPANSPEAQYPVNADNKYDQNWKQLQASNASPTSQFNVPGQSLSANAQSDDVNQHQSSNEPNSVYSNLPSNLEDVIKNNRPQDRTIEDVPPPPLPVGHRSRAQKAKTPVDVAAPFL